MPISNTAIRAILRYPTVIYTGNGGTLHLGTLIASNAVIVGNSTVNSSINSTSISIGNILLNGTAGSNGQILVSNGTGLYWSSAALADTFETVNKNIKAYDSNFAYHGNGFLNTITYTIPSAGTITKTFNYTGSFLTSVALSGNTPGGIPLTKTLSYTGNNITGIVYS